MSASRRSDAGDVVPPVLQFEGICKSFSGIPVLREVGFSVGSGRITALVGENGAGKSTLMNLLGGNLAPDAGRMLLAGEPHAPRSPAAATGAGIAFVHQELSLFPNLTVAENLAIADFPLLGDRSHPDISPGTPRLRIPWIDRRALATRTRELLARVGLDLPTGTPLARLSAGERQLVEIARALGVRARVLILDEPTSSLTARESARLFELMRRLRADGLSILFISHALGDVLRESDDIVILRDGAVVGTGPARQFDLPGLVSRMVGRELSQLFPERHRSPPGDASPSPGEPILRVRGISQPGVVRDVSFDLFPGEILGIAGLMGAGRSELARILFGLDPADGEIRLAGQTLSNGPRSRMAAGLAFLTEDRRSDGLCLEASIAENIALVTLRKHARVPPFHWLNRRSLAEAVRSIRAAVRLTPAAADTQAVRTLSGGNQQKVVLAKWLLARPRVMILDEPTRGIDVGAKFEIYQLIRQVAGSGGAVLLISSELEELIGLCDRMLVMSRGRCVDQLAYAEFDQARILRSALPA